jgi:hypothetical protein
MKDFMKRKLLKFFFGCSVILFYSCKTDIRKIKEDRSQYLNKEVNVEGVVNAIIPLTGIYELKQDNATIYVYTPIELPNEEEKIVVKGIVKEKKLEAGGVRLLNEVYIQEVKRYK